MIKGDRTSSAIFIGGLALMVGIMIVGITVPDALKRPKKEQPLQPPAIKTITILGRSHEYLAELGSARIWCHFPDCKFCNPSLPDQQIEVTTNKD